MSFLNNLFGKKANKSDEQNQITVKQIEEIFAYGKKENLIGASLPKGQFESLGNFMEWKSQPYYYKGYKDIPAQDVPAHIKWPRNGIFAFVGIVNGNVEYKFGSNRECCGYVSCPITTDKKEITLINEIFAAWYQYFNLPYALDEKNVVKPIIDRSDKIKLIREYLKNETADFFDEAFNEAFDIVIWVDWQEEDENIIQYCEDIIQTKNLTTSMNDTDDEIGFEILINYTEQAHKIPYKGNGADRDTTIITLNEVLKPDFEIRFCTHSSGSDTLAFLPLTTVQWLELEKEFGQEKVKQHFRPINRDSKMFG